MSRNVKIISWMLRSENLLNNLRKCFESVFFYVAHVGLGYAMQVQLA